MDTLIVNKKFTTAGREYRPGDTFDPKELPEHKIRQFLNQRMVIPARKEPATSP